MRCRIQIRYQPAPVPYMIQEYSPPPHMILSGVVARSRPTLMPTYTHCRS